MVDNYGVWEDLDPESDSFTKTDMLIKSKGGLSAQHFRKAARNTSYIYRHSATYLLIENEQLTAGQEKDFDTDRDYTDAYIHTFLDGDTAPLPLRHTILPLTENRPTFLQLTNAYQAIYLGSDIKIKYLDAGGFRIKNEKAVDTVYLTGLIIEIRKIGS